MLKPQKKDNVVEDSSSATLWVTGDRSASLRPCKQPGPLGTPEGWSMVTFLRTHGQKQIETTAKSCKVRTECRMLQTNSWAELPRTPGTAQPEQTSTTCPRGGEIPICQSQQGTPTLSWTAWEFFLINHLPTSLCEGTPHSPVSAWVSGHWWC